MEWKKGDPETNRKLGGDDLDRFLWKLNCFEKIIEFTVEREKDVVMTFLDMLVKRERNTFLTSVYRKETHTQIYIHGSRTTLRLSNLGFEKG